MCIGADVTAGTGTAMVIGVAHTGIATVTGGVDPTGGAMGITGAIGAVSTAHQSTGAPHGAPVSISPGTDRARGWCPRVLG